MGQRGAALALNLLFVRFVICKAIGHVMHIRCHAASDSEKKFCYIQICFSSLKLSELDVNLTSFKLKAISLF